MKITYLLFGLSIFSLNLYCQTEWTKHPGNPGMLPGFATEWDEEFIGFGTVIYHNNNYHMWYTGDLFPYGGQIGHAISDDGIIWTKDINNPVLDTGPEGSWDESGIAMPCVMVIDDTFHMWYNGHRGNLDNFDFQVGHAI